MGDIAAQRATYLAKDRKSEIAFAAFDTADVGTIN
jgi:hypothetical protein